MARKSLSVLISICLAGILLLLLVFALPTTSRQWQYNQSNVQFIQLPLGDRYGKRSDLDFRYTGKQLIDQFGAFASVRIMMAETSMLSKHTLTIVHWNWHVWHSEKIGRRHFLEM